MHQHTYIGGSIIGNIVKRYCPCGTTLIFNNNKKILETFCDDEQYYRKMAEQLLEK